jgi:hypothetical protein
LISSVGLLPRSTGVDYFAQEIVAIPTPATARLEEKQLEKLASENPGRTVGRGLFRDRFFLEDAKCARAHKSIPD